MDKTDAVCVLGAGVVGLTTAIRLREAGHRVDVLAAEKGSSICSSNAGAIWGPFLSDDDRVFNWSFRTLEVLRELSSLPESGVTLVSGLLAADYVTEMPEWFDMLEQDHNYDGEMPVGYVRCWKYKVPIIDMPKYLLWLENSLQNLGSEVQIRKVEDIEHESEKYAWLINCTGLGSVQLCGDDGLRPIKGQLVVLENPGLKDFFAERGVDETNLFYWMPQGEKIVLGGTAEEDFEHFDVDKHQVDRMIKQAEKIDPRLGSAEVISTRVGLRPYRKAVRLERDDIIENVIHNYGHGGSGVSISWGCAEDITTMITV